MSNNIIQKCKSNKKKPKKNSCTFKCSDSGEVFDIGGENLVSTIKTKCWLFS